MAGVSSHSEFASSWLGLVCRPHVSIASGCIVMASSDSSVALHRSSGFSSFKSSFVLLPSSLRLTNVGNYWNWINSGFLLRVRDVGVSSVKETVFCLTVVGVSFCLQDEEHNCRYGYWYCSECVS